MTFRGTLLRCTLAFALGLLAGCGGRQGGSPAVATLGLDAPLPDTPAPGTRLVIGDPMVQPVIEQNGWLKDLGFTVQWAQISGGPAVTEAFHAGALDVGSSADVPPIRAAWVGIPVKIIAVQLHRDPAGHPLYVLSIAPHAQIRSLADLRGKRIAYSPGQVQGEVVLRTLKDQGLTTSDVTLVELPSTADVYTDALSSGSVDVAPIAAGAVARRYLEHFSKDGAQVLPHGPFRDDLTLLFVRVATLQDPGKAAALRRYVAVWTRANQWINNHPGDWAQLYWVREQRLSGEDARAQIEAFGPRYTPPDFTEAIQIERHAIEILAPATGRPPFAAETLFDRRFQAVVGDALAQDGAASPAPPAP
jgi:sulfonate transport system substrate-binding protein